MAKEIEKIDASEAWRAINTYRVGTFKHDFGVLAYLRDYNPQWPGCVEYDVEAPDGTAAKKAAIKARKERQD